MKTTSVLVFAGCIVVAHNTGAAASSVRGVEEAAANRDLKSAASITASDVSSIAVSTITLATDIASIVNSTSSSKDCHQLACWISSSTYDCQFAAANWVQDNLTKGRNSFGVESSDDTGMWVRYWRTLFYPPDQGDIAKGTCTDGTAYTVTNCQYPDGSVYC